MPEPSPARPAAGPAPAPRLTVRLGPVRAAQPGPGRGLMAPEELRAAGIALNAGRRHGWKKRLSQLLRTPETTIAAWASRSAGNARPIPGAVAVTVRLMADLVRQAAAEGASQAEAVHALSQRIDGLCPEPPQAVRLAALSVPVPPAAEPPLLLPADGAILVETARPASGG